MSGPTSRVFVARLAGVVVFDPNGDQVGRVRDVIVILRPGSQQPRVLGLVVEVPPRRAIFLPITRVTGIEAGAVMTTGTVSLADEVFAHDLQVVYPSGQLEQVQTKLTHSGNSSFTNAIYRLKDGHWDKFVEVHYHKLLPEPPG